jgi:hypothetical protein
LSDNTCWRLSTSRPRDSARHPSGSDPAKPAPFETQKSLILTKLDPGPALSSRFGFSEELDLKGYVEANHRQREVGLNL